ncbi:MAG: CRISPR-associated protein Cas4 [Nautiliaceae bacterium]
MLVTGTIINYYFVCPTKMWLFANKINLEDNSEDVRVGKVLHEISEDKVSEVGIGGIKVDKITKDYVIEVKKSDSDIEAGKWQLMYYLYILKQKGIEKKGRLEVFEKNKQDKKRFVIELSEENEKKLLEILEDIERMLSSDTPPKPKFESKCRKCAYYEYCFL